MTPRSRAKDPLACDLAVASMRATFRPKNARSAALAAIALGALTVSAVALAQAWQPLPDAARFARAGAPQVTLEIHEEGGGGCGGGGCTSGVEIRNVRGSLPARSLSYYYSDRPGSAPGCLGPDYSALFNRWSEAVIAPIAGDASHRPSCGIGILVGQTMQYWVILRVRALPAAATPPPTRP